MERMSEGVLWFVLLLPAIYLVWLTTILSRLERRVRELRDLLK